jgi:hypothetical protein
MGVIRAWVEIKVDSRKEGKVFSIFNPASADLQFSLSKEGLNQVRLLRRASGPLR